MKKIIVLISFLIITFSFSKDNFSEMSNEELIAIIGYVSDKNKTEFFKELKSRVSTMSQKEKVLYEKNIKKVQKDEK